MAEVADFPWLQRQAAIALECVSLRDDEPAVLRTIQAAMAVGELRARWLRPEAVFDAAAQADVDDARDALSVFTRGDAVAGGGAAAVAWLAGRSEPGTGRALLAELGRQTWGCPSGGALFAATDPG